MINETNEVLLTLITHQHAAAPELNTQQPEASIDIKSTKQLTYQGMGKKFQLDPEAKHNKDFESNC